MAPIPDRQPDLPEPGAERDQAPGRPPQLIPRWGSPAAQRGLAALIAVSLLALAWHFNLRPRHAVLNALGDTARSLLATVVVFGICGFGLVRLLLPERLRDGELLWVLPTGGCAGGLLMTALGFAAIPYAVSLVLVLCAGLAFAAYAVRSRGWPAVPSRRLGWPVYMAFVVLVVALVPMLFHQHYAAPVGTGSDAHVATGTATFLKHTYPTAVNVTQPINQMPPTWRSKYPIYYMLAAVSSVSALGTWQVLAPLAAVLLALAAIGMFLIAREMLGAPAAVAVAAMAVAGLDRMALHTVLNPYFNQTWGFFAMPFTVVLGWWVVQPGVPRPARVRTLGLVAIFALVLAFAYPLAAPIPAVPIAVFAWSERRQRIARGERVLRLRGLYRGPRSLIWIVPVVVLMAVPAAGAVQKALSAANVLAPGHSLQGWGGDLGHFIPFNHFLSLPNSPLGTLLLIVVAGLTVLGLLRQPRPLAWGLGGLMLVGLLLGVYLRHRQYGYYFHFKLLAFIGPLVLLIAVVGAGQLRRPGVALIALLAVLSGAAVVAELGATGYQLPQATIQLSSWVAWLPREASVRLDMTGPEQLWGASFLTGRRVCSQAPLLGTDYPHVAISRKADYIVADRKLGRPADAVGPALRENEGYELFRESSAVPGLDHCTQRRFDRIYSGAGYSSS
ncbi:MAG: hypothetical protein ACR2JH_05840 [Solirubrobacteraceae bacterium]